MIKSFIAISFFLFAATNTFGQYNTVMYRMYSQNVKDSFEIYISKPADYSASKSYDVIYYCDANLKSGKELRLQIPADDKLAKRGNFIFAGIGHIGNYHILRRRDFILPFISKGDTLPKSKVYGHIKDFYKFLTNELIPSVQSSYHCSNKRTIIGHSLGGLFVFYCLFQNDTAFTNYMALSPALWIDNYSIFHFNKITTTLNRKSYLYLSAGSEETMNRILGGADSMNEFLIAKQYNNLKFEFKVHPGKTHNTQVPESLKYILKNL
jgi:predicted alpha/beta superfamily hydrolase